jgi:hypothetical protein
MTDEYNWKDAMQSITDAINLGIAKETAKLEKDETIHVEVINKKTHAVVNVTRVKEKEKE